MDRSEKRRLERERQKLEKRNVNEDETNRQWYSQLPVSRKIFIGKFIERRTIENDNLVAAIMDKCMMGSMDDNTSVDITLMKKVIKDSNDYILDYKEFLDKYKDGGFDMIENVKVREEVKAKMKLEISRGSSKVKCMATLKKEYNLPAAELSELWIDCKVELDQEKKLKKVVVESECEDVSINNWDNAKMRIMDYIMDGKSQDSCMCLIQDEFKLSINEVLDLWNECMNKSNNTESYCGLVEHPEIKRFETEQLMCEPARLEVIDEVKVVKGQFGYYHKSKDGIRFSEGEELLNKDIAYKNKQRVMEARDKVIKEIDTEICTLENKLIILRKQKYDSKSKFDELEQVFDL